MPDLKLGRGFTLPLEIVTEASAIVATRGAGKSSASAVVVEECFTHGVQVVVFDRTGVYWGLRSNAKGTGAGLRIYVLGGPHGDVPLEPAAGKLIADLVVDTGHSFVLDLSDFSKSAAVRFAADFVERLYDRKARHRSTLLLVMDEAHFYAPQTPRGGFKGDSARLMGAMEDVVGLGRSRGLGVLLTTQRTQSLNKAVLDLIETLFVMRMLSPRAREAVRDWISEKHEQDEQGVIASLKKLPVGTAWVWSPLRGVLRQVALRRIRTYDSYVTPTPGEVVVEPKARAKLDLAALGRDMEETAERAKENDPAELRRQIADLQRQLREAPPREPETVEVEVIREVPVLTDDEREKLHHIAKAIDGLSEQATNVAAVGASLLGAIEIRRAPETRPADPPRVSSTSRRTPGATGPNPASPSRPAPGAAPGRGASGGASTISDSDARVLDALAWYEAVGIPTPTKPQVGFVAKYKPKGGRFANVLGELRKRGLIDYPSSGHLALTPEGRAFARVVTLPRDNAAVHAAVLDRLEPSQRKILSFLLIAYPGSVAREDLAAATEYEPGGGRFANLLGSLRTLGLIDYPERGTVRAGDVLFPLDALAAAV